MGESADVDTSAFQNVVLMLIGVLMVMLISNVLTIISNPDNVNIGAVITGAVYSDEETEVAQPKFQNTHQDPIYIDVEPNQIIIYPRKTVVAARDLALRGNPFEELLDRVEANKTGMYIVLLLRPGSYQLQWKLRDPIRERGIDVGFEPFETGRPIVIQGGEQEEGEAAAETEDTPTTDAPAENLDARLLYSGGAYGQV